MSLLSPQSWPEQTGLYTVSIISTKTSFSVQLSVHECCCHKHYATYMRSCEQLIYLVPSASTTVSWAWQPMCLFDYHQRYGTIWFWLGSSCLKECILSLPTPAARSARRQLKVTQQFCPLIAGQDDLGAAEVVLVSLWPGFVNLSWRPSWQPAFLAL